MRAFIVIVFSSIALAVALPSVMERASHADSVPNDQSESLVALPGTKPLTTTGDLAMQMVAGIDQYLSRELAASVTKRFERWQPDFSSIEAYSKSLEPNRQRLRRILGVVDQRVPVTALEYIATTTEPALIAKADKYSVHQVRWPVLNGVDAEGLLLEPNEKPRALVVAVPDADWTPEMLVGLADGFPEKSQYARRLAENGCRVLVPMLIDRRDTDSGVPRLRMTNQPHREFIYRMSFELGRHIIGYEVQKVLAAVDYFSHDPQHPPIGVIGYGEGGLLALYAAALDPRIQSTVVSGYFGPREELWREPIYRNVWALLQEFGDTELAMLVAPRSLIIEESKAPAIDGPPAPRKDRAGAAPGSLRTPDPTAVLAEWRRTLSHWTQLKRWSKHFVLVSVESPPGNPNTLEKFLEELCGHLALLPSEKPPKDQRKLFDPNARHRRQFQQLCEFNQKLLRESGDRRREFWSKAKTESLAEWQKSTEYYRNYLGEEVIGKLPQSNVPANVRTRKVYDEPRWQGYEVVLDVHPDVFAYGVLLVPKDLKPSERRPVVVCQHGLEGRPQDVVNPKQKTPYYNSFGAQLADRGYVVYAPQNPYIGQDKFRVLQRKANPLKLSLFSFIVAQHERTLDWLAELPFVDPARMGFYGLSYGGKTAMRVPALLPRYALSICSGDFNEWIWKNVNLEWRGSYMFTGEYEMVEFDLGNTFNYAEMAALILPRPFMVERGHDDGVGIDEWVAFEYAKVRRLYAKLGIADRTTIEFFQGGHVINGKGSFDFLAKNLSWPH